MGKTLAQNKYSCEPHRAIESTKYSITTIIVAVFVVDCFVVVCTRRSFHLLLQSMKNFKVDWNWIFKSAENIRKRIWIVLYSNQLQLFVNSIFSHFFGISLFFQHCWLIFSRPKFVCDITNWRSQWKIISDLRIIRNLITISKTKLSPYMRRANLGMVSHNKCDSTETCAEDKCEESFSFFRSIVVFWCVASLHSLCLESCSQVECAATEKFVE